jgi:hypothetical protein
MARLGLVLIRVLKGSNAIPRDSFFFFCLKDRTSKQSLTTLDMGKKCKQKLEHRASQSPCLFPMVASIVMFHLTCSQCIGMHMFAQTHLGGNRGFHHLRLKRVDPKPC